MAAIPTCDRPALAQKRLVNVLRTHVIATARTLEQKISDAGPFDQRIHPHVLTPARNKLIRDGTIRLRPSTRCPWYHLADSASEDVDRRLTEQKSVHDRMCENQFTARLGQTLEVAVFKALQSQTEITFFGGFPDLHEHDDSTPYKKIEPPEFVSGKPVDGGIFDFLLTAKDAGPAGLEAKNVREWLYPDREEVKDLLAKCCSVDAIPVLVARRIPFATFKVLHPCGVIMHETFNQLFPASEAGLARKAADKRLLGYHDIRIGNEPDGRLLTFITKNLPKLLVSARAVFEDSCHLLAAYGSGAISYPEFAKRVKDK